MKKRKTGLIVGLIMLAMLLGLAGSHKPMTVRAEDYAVTISADKTSVLVGETFTLTVSASHSNFGFLKATVVWSGSGSVTPLGDISVGMYPGLAAQTYTFRADSAGPVDFDLLVDNENTMDMAEQSVGCSVSGCTVTITEPTQAPPPTDEPTEAPTDAPTQAPEPPEPPATQPPETPPPTTEPPTTEAPETLSNNCYLEALSVYPGRLSPAFSPEVSLYEVWVGSEVTQLSVSVVTADVDAIYRITSTDLTHPDSKGKTVIDIRVIAADGSERWYSIWAYREAATTEAPLSSAAPTEPPSETPSGEDPLEITIGADSARVLRELGDLDRPEGYDKVSYTFRGVTVEALKGLGNGLLLLPVEDGSGTDRLYLYDEASSGFYPYVGLQISAALYTAMPFPSGETVPDGYRMAAIDFGGSQIDVWVRSDASDGTFSVFYAMNWAGETALYRYDAEEGTLQRVSREELASPVPGTQDEPESSSAPTEPESTGGGTVSADYLSHYEETVRALNRRDTVMFVIMVILLICMVAMYLLFSFGRGENAEKHSKKGGASDGDDGFDEEEESDEDFDEDEEFDEEESDEDDDFDEEEFDEDDDFDEEEFDGDGDFDEDEASEEDGDFDEEEEPEDGGFDEDEESDGDDGLGGEDDFGGDEAFEGQDNGFEDGGDASGVKEDSGESGPEGGEPADSGDFLKRELEEIQQGMAGVIAGLAAEAAADSGEEEPEEAPEPEAEDVPEPEEAPEPEAAVPPAWEEAAVSGDGGYALEEDIPDEEAVDFPEEDELDGLGETLDLDDSFEEEETAERGAQRDPEDSEDSVGELDFDELEFEELDFGDGNPRR